MIVRCNALYVVLNLQKRKSLLNYNPYFRFLEAKRVNNKLRSKKKSKNLGIVSLFYEV